MERLAPSSISKEHWTLTIVLEKWVSDATRVCDLAWTSRCCYRKAVPSSILEEHWTLTTILEKWVPNITGVCIPTWTSRRCFYRKVGPNTS